MYRWNKGLFDELVLPPALNRDRLIQQILIKTASNEILYPDYDVFKAAIGIWSANNTPIWQKLLDTTEYEYNPIHNYDRTEERTWTEERKETEGITAKDTHALDQTDNTVDAGTQLVTGHATNELEGKETGSLTGSHTSHTTGTTDDVTNSTTEEQVSAYNSSGYQPSTKSTSNTDYNSSVEGDVKNSDTESTTKNTNNTTHEDSTQDTDHRTTVDLTRDVDETTDRTSDRTTDEGTSHTESVRAYGNIGVTTTQQMIQQEREIVQFNIYDFIVDDFRREFCILVY